MKPKIEPTPKPTGRTSLCWLVVNRDGKLLAILDSESEAYWFTRNRGHATDAVYFQAPIDYAMAPALLEALKEALAQMTGPAGIWGDGRGNDGKKTGLSHQEFNELFQARINAAREAIRQAEGE